jgi:hypothetical protein
MEIIQNKVQVKLDKEERDSLIATMGLLEKMVFEMPCTECPFEERCNHRHKDHCLLRTLEEDLRYINNICN